MNFRVAKTADLTSISNLVNSAYRGDSSRAGWTTEADYLDGQRTDVEALEEMMVGDQVILLAEDAEAHLKGCVYLKKRDNNQAYLGLLTVLPQEQAKGLGRIILAQAEQYAVKNWRCQKMQMTVITIRKELLEWYGRRGYSMTGAREAFPYGNPRSGIPKRTDLEFYVLEKNINDTDRS